jgi:hypothetical protein
LNLTPGIQQNFYNNVVIPLSNAMNTTGKLYELAGVAATALAGAALPFNASLSVELGLLQGDMLSLAKTLKNAPSANNLQPFVDPPLTLPPVNPSGPLTSSMIATFQQIGQNLATEMGLIATLTQLGSQIQAALANNQDATSLIQNYIASVNSLKASYPNCSPLCSATGSP